MPHAKPSDFLSARAPSEQGPGQPRPGDREYGDPFLGAGDPAFPARPPADDLASPARRMQSALGAEFSAAEAEDRWPLRLTLGFVFASCGAFWVAVYFVVAALVG